MLRKLTLITMVVVLGLAVFAGCSNDAVTSTDGSEAFSRNGYEGNMEGRVWLDDDPVGANEAKVFIYDDTTIPMTLIDFDATNSSGYYGIYGVPIGNYTAVCELYDGSGEPIDSQWELIEIEAKRTLDLDWEFYSE